MGRVMDLEMLGCVGSVCVFFLMLFGFVWSVGVFCRGMMFNGGYC